MKVDLFSIGKFTVHSYGLLIGLGFLVAVFLGSYRAKKVNLSPDHYSNIAIFTLIIGFLGGKLMYMIVEFKRLLADPMSVIGSEGFVVYGGIITGVLSIFVYCKINKLSFLNYIDLLVPCVAINQGFGRLGCFMAGCCYGRETTSPFGVVFPPGSLAPAGVPLIPTQLISAAFDFALGILLIVLFKKFKRSGDIGATYFCAYSIGRFLVECLRNDERGSVGALSTSQFISFFILAFSIVFFAINRKLNVKPLWMEPESEVNDTDAEKTKNDVDEEKTLNDAGAE
ncbi:MAG: prolipoprotein diacylglyceryl transferase [Lachnospiraceae bacterium]|nr:prolipoprotein diacylglyceryl transferase [Lachnospiraceae bacterium]